MSATAERQARIQSPSYPSLSLENAVAAVAKIEGRCRSSTVDRVDAARLLGFAGATGPSSMVLAALSSFGLVEKAGKGELRVTERARSILYPSREEEKRLALREAALSPQLYRDLRERFPDVAVPPEEGVITYLNRQGFNPTAVRPAARAFLQTVAYLEEAGVSGGGGASVASPHDVSPALRREEPKPIGAVPPSQGFHPATPAPAVANPLADVGLPLNEPILNIRSGTVRIEALLDYDGLTELENQIRALRMILKPRKTATSAAPSSEPENLDAT